MGQPQPPKQIAISHDDMKGLYANAVRVSVSPHEFSLDFYRDDFATPGAPMVVVARIALSHLCAGQLSDILEKQWKAYAERSFPTEVTDVLSTGGPKPDDDAPSDDQPEGGDDAGS